MKRLIAALCLVAVMLSACGNPGVPRKEPLQFKVDLVSEGTLLKHLGPPTQVMAAPNNGKLWIYYPSMNHYHCMWLFVWLDSKGFVEKWKTSSIFE